MVAGAWAAARTGNLTSGILMGLWSGLVSGLVVAIAILLLTFVPLSALHITLGDVAEFRQSGLPDLATYMAGENIAAATNHLWIAPVVGILSGSVGGLLGSAVSPRAARRSSG